jgi:hypothetical protein
MTDETTSAAPAMPESFSDPREAMNWLAQQDEKPEPNSSAEQPDGAAEHKSADEADAAPREEAPSETEGNDPEAEKLPPVERPRSWSKDDETEWNALPRAAQEKIAAREQARETELRRTQNEAAEARKASEATRAQAESKAQIGEKVKTLQRELDELTFVNNSQFGEIKSQADLDKLSQEQLRLAASDPVTAGQIGAFLQAWQTHQYKLSAKQTELQQAQQGATSEFQQTRAAYAAEQDKLFREALPEFADQEKLTSALKRAVPILNEYGLTTDKLQQWCESKAGYEIVGSAGFQRLVADALKYRDVMAAKQTVAAKPVPAVQRPGARQSGGNASALQAATQAFNLNPNAKNAAALAIARRGSSTH